MSKTTTNPVADNTTENAIERLAKALTDGLISQEEHDAAVALENARNSGISEQQQDLVSGTTETSENTSDGDLQPVAIVGEVNRFADINAAWDRNELTDEDLLASYEEKEITEDQLVAICGDTLAELQERVNKARDEQVEKDKTNGTLSFETIHADLTERINSRRLNAGGALALVKLRLAKGEISGETAERLEEWLYLVGNEDGSISHGANVIDPGKMIADDIVEHYKPTADSAESRKEAESIISGYMRHTIEFEGTKASRLIVDFANIAYAALKSGDFTISYQETPIDVDGKQMKMRRCNAHQKLWAYIKANKLLGAPKEQTEKVGDKVMSLGMTYDPYADKGLLAMADKLCQKALMLAYGRLGVQFGYCPKTRERPSRKQVFKPATDMSEEEINKSFVHVCVPKLILQPNTYKYETVRVQTGTNDSGTPTYKWITRAVPEAANDDTLLGWIPDDAVDPLFQHIFAEHVLEYDDEARGREDGSGVAPTGYINGSFDPKIGSRRGRQRQNKQSVTDENTKLKQQIAKVTGERDAAQGGLDPENRVKSMQALEGVFHNPKLKVELPEMCYGIAVAVSVIDRVKETKSLPDDLAHWIAKLYQECGELIKKDHGDGTYDFELGNIYKNKIAA